MSRLRPVARVGRRTGMPLDHAPVLARCPQDAQKDEQTKEADRPICAGVVLTFRARKRADQDDGDGAGSA